MRWMSVMTAASILFISGPPSFAEEWIEYVSRTDFFSANFPGEPKVKDIAYTTEYGITLPGRVYSAEVGANRYSVTVVNYADTEKLHTERSNKCRAEGSDACGGSWSNDLRGAITYATWKFIQRDAKVTNLAFYVAERVEGQQLQLTNADRSRTFAVIQMHEDRLYILEGTAAPGLPPPALFPQSLGFVDKEGKRVRYETLYSNGFPPPRRR